MQNKNTWHMLIIFMLINISVGKPLVATGKPNPLVVALTIAATAQTAAGWLTCPPCQLDDISSFFNDYSNPEILSGTSEEVCAIKSFGDYYVELIEALSKKNILLPKSRALREEELNPYKLPACLRAIDSIEKDLIYLSKCRLKKCPDPQRIAENLLYLEFQKVLNEARSRYTDITDTHAGFTPINYCSASSLTEEELGQIMIRRQLKYKQCLNKHKLYLAIKAQDQAAKARQPKIKQSKKN